MSRKEKIIEVVHKIGCSDWVESATYSQFRKARNVHSVSRPHGVRPDIEFRVSSVRQADPETSVTRVRAQFARRIPDRDSLSDFVRFATEIGERKCNDTGKHWLTREEKIK